jgi:K+-transporting ATPase A subunit
MSILIFVLVLIAIFLAVASGIWVAVALVRAISTHSNQLTRADPQNNKNDNHDAQ